MADDFEVQRSVLARRGMIRRIAILGLAGAIGTVAMALSGADKAEAQGYMPIPPPRFEPPPPPPPPHYVWQPGHWRWNGYAYVWFRGTYVLRGPRYAQFVPGHWAMRYGNWVWIPQHWQ